MMLSQDVQSYIYALCPDMLRHQSAMRDLLEHTVMIYMVTMQCGPNYVTVRLPSGYGMSGIRGIPKKHVRKRLRIHMMMHGMWGYKPSIHAVHGHIYICHYEYLPQIDTRNLCFASRLFKDDWQLIKQRIHILPKT